MLGGADNSNGELQSYIIGANKADKMDLRESQGWLNNGYQGAVTGAALGSGITAYNGGGGGATLGIGLAAGLVELAADSMVEDVNYTMVTVCRFPNAARRRSPPTISPPCGKAHPV